MSRGEGQEDPTDVARLSCWRATTVPPVMTAMCEDYVALSDCVKRTQELEVRERLSPGRHGRA